jgi:hypothetical protein
LPTADVDVETILEALLRHDVDFVVIGGFAAELHDVPIPPTRDIDITPANDLDNLNRLISALDELDARLRVPDGPNAGVAVPGGFTPEFLQSMISVALVTMAGPLDISLLPDGTEGYVDLERGSSRMALASLLIPVASLDDTIRSKEAAGREKDLLVLPALREHHRRQRRPGR